MYLKKRDHGINNLSSGYTGDTWIKIVVSLNDHHRFCQLTFCSYKLNINSVKWLDKLKTFMSLNKQLLGYRLTCRK